MARNTALDLARLRSRLEESNHPWEMSRTSITELTESERELRLGVPIPPGTDHQSIQAAVAEQTRTAKAATAASVGAPTSFDARNVAGVNYDGGGVRDQAGCGSCVAFGTCAALEVVYRYTRGITSGVDLSEAQLFYCYGRADGATCGTGWLPEPAYTHVRDTGLTMEDYYPYTAGDQNCANLNADWPNHKVNVSAFQSLTNDPAAMKQYISSYGAITACFFVYQDFFSYRSGVYRYVTGDLAGGHCVALIGYDDVGGYWIGRNSWSSAWGEGGYFKIAYGQCGIESWHVVGASGITLRSWLPDQQVLGLWSNESDGNVWAYGSDRGWLKLDSGTVATNIAMFGELASSKALGRPVGLFEDSGSVQQLYAW